MYSDVSAVSYGPIEGLTANFESGVSRYVRGSRLCVFVYNIFFFFFFYTGEKGQGCLLNARSFFSLLGGGEGGLGRGGLIWLACSLA